METFERARLDAYFSRTASRFTPAERPAAFLITHLLHAKGIRVTVYDIDPVRRTQPPSQGFTVARDRASGSRMPTSSCAPPARSPCSHPDQ